MQQLRWILFVLFAALSVHPVFAQVVAGFNASPTSGCAPLVVSFTNTTVPSSGTTYVWNMGNGTGPITLVNPGATYLTAGTYTVTLTAINGSASNTYSRVITVHPSPVVNFTASSTTICPGGQVTFTSTTTAGVPGPVTYLWSSGDGYTSTVVPYTHTYSLPGFFHVSLTATNSVGCASVLTRPSLIQVYPPPVPAFTVSTRRVCPSTGAVTFTNTSTGIGPLTYRWTFGDGSPASTSPNPSHLYTTPGVYAVKLVVTDGRGCKDSITVPNYITVSPLNAAFTGPDSACVHTPVTFTNTSSNFHTYYWYYGDGTPGGIPTHTYTTRGAYTVMLVVRDSFCSDTASKNFIVPNPAINFTIAPARPCPSPITATFTATVPSGSSVQWSFGDATFGTGGATTHTYLRDTFFTVKMITTNAIGCKDTSTGVYKIHDIVFNLGNTGRRGGCAPLVADFYADVLTTLPPGSPLFPAPYPYDSAHVWTFGVGLPDIDTIQFRHTYTAVGVYPVSLTYYTKNGCTATKKDTVFVGDSSAVATFTATPTRQCFNNNLIKYTRTLLAGPVDQITYYWLWGDGIYGYRTEDTARVPVRDIRHHFELPGVFSDTLVIIYNGCYKFFIRKDHITIDSPQAKARLEVICPLGRAAKFINFSLGDDKHLWLFGDGTTSTLDSPIHIFSAPIIYENKLIVYDTVTGCVDTAIITVDFRPVAAHITASDTAICRDDSVIFKANVTYGYPSYYKWFSGSGTGYGDMYPTFVNFYNVPGVYGISLVIYDQNNCPDTLTKPNYITVAKPDAHFRITPANGCMPQVTAFADSTVSRPSGTFITNYRWDFGDGAVALTPSPAITHIYSTASAYTIKEIVTDNIGCKDTVSISKSLYDPKAAFFAVPQACAYSNVSFTNTSTPAATYAWSFGDGSTSTLVSPVHAYSVSGVFTARLIITESQGCKDTATRTITIAAPNAAFTMSDSVSICPPFTVHFTNASTGGISNLWSLGDGNTSIATNPNHIYTSPGLNMVRLIVTDAYGCKDTALRRVKIYGYVGAFTYNADSGCVPLTIHFDADLSNISLASSIVWDFADGVVSSPALNDTVSHTYLTPGGYLPRLILTNHAGCVSSSIGKDTIKVNEVIPGFTAIPDPLCLGDPVTVNDTSSSYWSHIASWNWTYGGASSSSPSPAISFSTTGIHTVTMQVTDGWGCVGTVSKSVSVYALTDISATPDAMICAGSETVLSNGAPGGVWSSGNPSIATVGSGTGIVTGVSAGIAVITYSLSSACYTTATVTVNAYPDAGSISGDTVLCVGETIILGNTVTGGVWRMAIGHATITSGGELKGITAGMDTAWYIASNASCHDTAKLPVIINPLPDAGTITGRNTICIDALDTLTATMPDGRWGSSNAAVVTIDSLTGRAKGVGAGNAVITYTVSSGPDGCTNFATFPVNVVNADFTISSVVTNVKCYGGTDGSIAVTINGGTPPFEFLWSVDSTTYSISGLDTGAYTVQIRSLANQCKLTETFQIVQPDSIKVTGIAEDDICYRKDGKVTTTVAGGVTPYQYLWTNGAKGSDVSGLTAGVYSVTVTDANGCRQYYAVEVKDSCADVLVRTALSPNGDGINDTWIIEGIDKFPGNNVKVFDKWGDMIYEKDGYNNEWDGTASKGFQLPDGTYFYLVKLNSSYTTSGKDVYTGAVLIKR